MLVVFSKRLTYRYKNSSLAIFIPVLYTSIYYVFKKSLPFVLKTILRMISVIISRLSYFLDALHSLPNIVQLYVSTLLTLSLILQYLSTNVALPLRSLTIAISHYDIL